MIAGSVQSAAAPGKAGRRVNDAAFPAPGARQAARPHLTRPHLTAPSGSEAAVEGFTTPDWVKDAIFYQVFPDRFANGDLGNDPIGTVPWGTQPTNDAFMGGDLTGLTDKLAYLKDLGVNALYLNPVFESPSNHKYDIVNYEKVDDAFGGDHALKTLVDSAHGSGMKLMLDGVFNHTSLQHPWFQDVRAKGPRSEHFDKYDVQNFPITYTRDDKGVLRSPDYKSWWGFATLPELRTTNPSVRDYFLTGENAIVKRWLRDTKVDGWRMDVADEVEPDFWREARKQIKATNPEAYLLAENWHDASEYLRGDQFDGAMNYRYFQQPAVSFFAKKQITSDEFVNSLKNGYPKEAQQAMFNILDTHDTPRFITEADGDWYRLRPAAIFQMTYVGAPVIYYGDELGMEGKSDPDSRRAMPWERAPAPGKAPARDAAKGAASLLSGTPVTPEVSSGALHSLYKQLIVVRKQEPALRRGEFAVLATHNDDRTLAYRRWVEAAPGAKSPRDAIVALNNDIDSHDVTVPVGAFAADGTRFTDSLSGRSYVVRHGQLMLTDVHGNHGALLLRDTDAPATAV